MGFPNILASIFVCISFHWQPSKLVYLEQILASVATYKTHVEVAVVTEEASQLDKVLQSWDAVHGDVVAVQAHFEEGDNERYRVLWAHRPIMEEAFRRGRFTTYIYLEDDQTISWPAMLSWGWDMEVLQPGGWQRGFFRTEISSEGAEMMLDTVQNVNMSSHKKIVDVGPTTDASVPPCTSSFHDLARRGHHCHVGFRCACHHQHYVQMHEPFQGFWIATHDLLARFMKSPWWAKETALKEPIKDMPRTWTADYPERTTWGVQLFDIPKGFDSAVVIPYDPSDMQLDRIASVRHLRNGYASDTGVPWGKIKVSEALVRV